MKMKILGTLAFVVILLASCVPAKEFEEMSQQYNKTNQANKELLSDNDDLSTKVAEQGDDIAALRRAVQHLEDDTVRLAQRNHRLQHNYNTTKKVNDDLLEQLQSALSGNNAETQDLLQQLQRYQNDLQAREDALSSAEAALLSKRSELEKAIAKLETAQREIEARNARILEMEEMLAQKDKLMRDLRDRVMSALASYQGNGLNVHMKDGLLYVSLDEQLLFKSGSWAVDPRGQAAIKELGKVLADNKDIQITIEGHTDNVPYNGSGPLQDNWDLSVKRATSIVKILLEGSSISAERITAAGRGEYIPLDKANTAEARQKNRRTEIILMPNMKDLMNALNGVQ